MLLGVVQRNPLFQIVAGRGDLAETEHGHSEQTVRCQQNKAVGRMLGQPHDLLA